MTGRVGIMTLPLTENFGGIIQCVALYRYLEDQGHDVFFIDKQNNRTLGKEITAVLLENIPGQNVRGIRARAIAARRHAPFLHRTLPKRTRVVRTGRQIEAELRRLDISTVIVGSDQVWRFEYQGDGNALNYFLDFGDSSLRRISYAASFGRSNWAYPDRKAAVTRLLSRFDAVAVRELSGVDIVRKELGREQCAVTVDPTLLVDSSFYDTIAAPPSAAPGKVLTYVLDHAEAIQARARQVIGVLEVKEIQSLSPDDNDASIDLPAWLRAFKDARFVVTDSFHGVAFSIIFGKPFIVLPNVNRGLDRFTSLLGQVGLTDRIVTGGTAADIAALAGRPIDYATVRGRLDAMKAASAEYLANALATRG